MKKIKLLFCFIGFISSAVCLADSRLDVYLFDDNATINFQKMAESSFGKEPYSENSFWFSNYFGEKAGFYSATVEKVGRNKQKETICIIENVYVQESNNSNSKGIVTNISNKQHCSLMVESSRPGKMLLGIKVNFVDTDSQ